MAEEHLKSNDDDSADANSNFNNQFLGKFTESEIVIGLVGAVGTNLDAVIKILEDRLKLMRYSVDVINVSTDIIQEYSVVTTDFASQEYSRVNYFMDKGNEARLESKDNSILTLGVAAQISSQRQKVQVKDKNPEYMSRHAVIVKSLKHPEEVIRFREIYPRGFYLIGVNDSLDSRLKFLISDKGMDKEEANQLIERDKNEDLPHGQHVAKTFHLSDMFVRLENNGDKLKNSLWRFLEIIFANPYKTPTFDEYAMYLSFASALCSADLSRQVGAVIAKNNTILATGANECPKFGGGFYWPELEEVEDNKAKKEDNRDFRYGKDANVIEKKEIITDIIIEAEKKGINKEDLKEILENSRISHLTEFGRAVHAEMGALLSCSRNNISCQDATLYTTTFPCHNCARHIIGAGIKRIVYIEPYDKSKAEKLHNEEILVGFSEDENNKVQFEQFIGIGPRRFFDLYSMNIGSGVPVKRKNTDGMIRHWRKEKSSLRLQMLPCSYLELELLAGKMFNEFIQNGVIEDEI